MTDSILLKLQDIFRHIFGDNSIVLDSSTNADTIDDWDSMMQILLLIQIEKDFQVKLDPVRISSLQNVGEMTEYLSTLLKQ